MPTADNEGARCAQVGDGFALAGMMETMEIAMTGIRRILIIAAALTLAGCGEPTKQPAGTAAMAGQPSRTGSADDQLVQPIDATWTIICAQLKGNGHVERAKVYKQQIAALTGLKGFYVVHEDEVSTLYFGYYRSIDPRPNPDEKDSAALAKEGVRAQRDLAKIRSLENNVGDPVFPAAGMSPLEPADPAAPADWDLRNVDRNKREGDPTKACWSLEIAIYKDSPLRKQYAVDTVREMRANGIKDAYFFHGKTTSSVCIGTWPESAVTEEIPDRGSPDDRPLIMTQGMPEGMKAGMKDATGHTVRPVQIKAVPVDPTLLETMSKYPARAVNGYEIKHTYKVKTGGVVEKSDPSLVIFIPREESGGMLGSAEREPAIDNGLSPMIDPNAGQPGGRLRSIQSGGNR